MRASHSLVRTHARTHTHTDLKRRRWLWHHQCLVWHLRLKLFVFCTGKSRTRIPVPKTHSSTSSHGYQVTEILSKVRPKGKFHRNGSHAVHFLNLFYFSQLHFPSHSVTLSLFNGETATCHSISHARFYILFCFVGTFASVTNLTR